MSSTPFKHALVDHPEPAWQVARQVPTSEVRISKLAQGRAVPRPWEKTALAEILGKTEYELFPEPYSSVVT